MARSFNGTTDEINVSSTPVTAVPLTIACWYNSDTQTANQTLVAVNDASANNQFALKLQGAAVGDPVRATTTVAGNSSNADTSVGYTAGAWQHGCAVYASATSRAAYLNGGSKGTNAVSRIPTGITEIDIGQSGSTIFFSGLLAEVGIWDIDLTDDEVASLAKGFSPLFIRPANLIFYAPIIGKSSPELDLVGGLSLTLSGTAKAEHPLVINPHRDPLASTPPAAVGDLSINKSDSITVSESIGRLVTSFVNKSDSITVSESVNRLVENYVNKSDSITVSESTKAEANNFVNKSDSITVTDTPNVLVPEYLVNVSDSVTITESIKSEVTSFINKSDSITITENVVVQIEVVGEVNVNVSDNLTITESVARLVTNFISKSDSITISESVKMEGNNSIAVSDNITVTELVNLLIPVLVATVSDSIVVSEGHSVIIDIPGATLSISINPDNPAYRINGVKIV